MKTIIQKLQNTLVVDDHTRKVLGNILMRKILREKTVLEEIEGDLDLQILTIAYHFNVPNIGEIYKVYKDAYGPLKVMGK